MELVCNTDWILTKNDILNKVKKLLTSVQEKQQEFIGGNSLLFPAEILSIPAKISKGENYQGLPYLILDYPRFFDQKDVFAIRTMFWWGNFFSITLHISGKYKTIFSDKIIQGVDLLKEKEFYICVHEEQWEHHFESNNYIPINNFSNEVFENKIRKDPFVKLANTIDISKWDNVQENLYQNFKMLIKVLVD